MNTGAAGGSLNNIWFFTGIRSVDLRSSKNLAGGYKKGFALFVCVCLFISGVGSNARACCGDSRPTFGQAGEGGRGGVERSRAEKSKGPWDGVGLLKTSHGQYSSERKDLGHAAGRQGRRRRRRRRRKRREGKSLLRFPWCTCATYHLNNPDYLSATSSTSLPTQRVRVVPSECYCEPGFICSTSTSISRLEFSAATIAFPSHD